MNVTWTITEIADGEDPRLREATSGDVEAVVCGDLRAAASLLATGPAGSAGLGIRYSYCPRPASLLARDRLRIELSVTSHDGGTDRTHAMAHMLETGAVGSFYRLERRAEDSVNFEEFGAACAITRPSRLRTPLFSKAFNPNVPDQYVVFDRCP